ELGLLLMRRLNTWRAKDQGRTVLWVTHHYEQAVQVADLVVVLRDGQLRFATEEQPRPMPEDVQVLHDWIYKDERAQPGPMPENVPVRPDRLCKEDRQRVTELQVPENREGSLQE